MGQPAGVLGQRRHRLGRELRRVPLVARHAGGGGGKASAGQEALGIHWVAAGLAGPQHGKAVLDAGALGHAVEHRAGLGIW